MQKWEIIYFSSTTNRVSPIFSFIESLSVSTQAKLANVFDLLEQYGTFIGLPHTKKLSGISLWELRILGKDNVRIIYVPLENKVILLLHGFIKKTQKTPNKEISVTLSRYKKYSFG